MCDAGGAGTPCERACPGVISARRPRTCGAGGARTLCRRARPGVRSARGTRARVALAVPRRPVSARARGYLARAAPRIVWCWRRQKTCAAGARSRQVWAVDLAVLLVSVLASLVLLVLVVLAVLLRSIMGNRVIVSVLGTGIIIIICHCTSVS